jgi:hypothetical protein
VPQLLGTFSYGGNQLFFVHAFLPNRKSHRFWVALDVGFEFGFAKY